MSDYIPLFVGRAVLAAGAAAIVLGLLWVVTVLAWQRAKTFLILAEFYEWKRAKDRGDWRPSRIVTKKPGSTSGDRP